MNKKIALAMVSVFLSLNLHAIQLESEKTYLVNRESIPTEQKRLFVGPEFAEATGVSIGTYRYYLVKSRDQAIARLRCTKTRILPKNTLNTWVDEQGRFCYVQPLVKQ